MCSGWGIDCTLLVSPSCVIYLVIIILSLCMCICLRQQRLFLFLFAFHWFKRFAFLLRVERDRYFFLGFALANFPIVAMGFLTLIHTSLTVTALALICRLQVNFLPSTSACFRSLINSTEKSIAVKYLLSSIHWVVFANQVLIYLILEPNRHLYLHLCKIKSYCFIQITITYQLQDIEELEPPFAEDWISNSDG